MNSLSGSYSISATIELLEYRIGSHEFSEHVVEDTTVLQVFDLWLSV